ncbi:hypothetical protein ACQJBY_062961 [Aegilops geniculata]
MPSAIISSLCSEQEVNAISVRHDIPEELTRFLAGNLPVCAPPDGAVGVYADALEAGMHFPLYDFFRRVLRHFGLAPSQFTPNGWRIMAEFVVLCQNTGVEPPPLAVFRHFFSLRTRGGWYHFQAKEAAGGLFTRLRKVKGWKTRFFFLTSPEPWQFPACWGGPPPKSSTGDPLLTDEEKTLAEKLLGANFSAQLLAQPPPAVRIGGINPSADEMTESMPAARMILRSSGRKRKLEETNANQGGASGEVAACSAWVHARSLGRAGGAAGHSRGVAGVGVRGGEAIRRRRTEPRKSAAGFEVRMFHPRAHHGPAAEGDRTGARGRRGGCGVAAGAGQCEGRAGRGQGRGRSGGAGERRGAGGAGVPCLRGARRRAPGLRCEGVRARCRGHEDRHAPALPAPRRQAPHRASGRASLIVWLCRRSILLESVLS